MKSNSALSSQAASLKRRSPRSGDDHRLDVGAQHALRGGLPQPHRNPATGRTAPASARAGGSSAGVSISTNAPPSCACRSSPSPAPSRSCWRARKSSTSLRLRSAMSPRIATTCSDWSASGCRLLLLGHLTSPIIQRQRPSCPCAGAVPKQCRARHEALVAGRITQAGSLLRRVCSRPAGNRQRRPSR